MVESQVPKTALDFTRLGQASSLCPGWQVSSARLWNRLWLFHGLFTAVQHNFMPDLAARKIGMISQIISRSPPYLHISSDREFIEFCPHQPKCNNMRKTLDKSVARVVTSKNISGWIPKSIMTLHTKTVTQYIYLSSDLTQESKSLSIIHFIVLQQTLLKEYCGKTERFTLLLF